MSTPRIVIVGAGQDTLGGFSTRTHQAATKPTPDQERLRLAAQKRVEKANRQAKGMRHG